MFLISANSCTVRTYKKDNGKHKGWYKNPNNPHHPNSTNPGNANPGKGNPKGKSKGKSPKH
ncbi:MAG: hypothetical protein M3R17_04415 [Bacteroidota bacterium]|nr:hypothetical protein [Bacteroidota bacterium]